MLMAKHNGQFINAVDARPGGSYRCPECGESLILKRGHSKIAHFAHRANDHCTLHDGESYEHLLGKQQIFEWARKKGWHPEIEVYLPQLEQRADILLKLPDQQIAIEFQCSPLSLTALHKRTQGYQGIGIKCYWFLGSPYMKKVRQRQTQKFIQKINQQYVIAFWDIRLGALRLVKLKLKEGRIGLREINQDYRTFRQLLSLPEIAPNINELCKGLPIICHQKIHGIQFTNHPEIYWRCLVVKQLNTIPLFTNFNRHSWLQFLWEIGLNEWVQFPCVSLTRLIYDYLELFTRQLQQDGIILIKDHLIILIEHPKYRQPLMEQLL